MRPGGAPGLLEGRTAKHGATKNAAKNSAAKNGTSKKTPAAISAKR